jgi:hypothetical protein
MGGWAQVSMSKRWNDALALAECANSHRFGIDLCWGVCSCGSAGSSAWTLCACVRACVRVRVCARVRVVVVVAIVLAGWRGVGCEPAIVGDALPLAVMVGDCCPPFFLAGDAILLGRVT